jgi:hypothetical protein
MIAAAAVAANKNGREAESPNLIVELDRRFTIRLVAIRICVTVMVNVDQDPAARIFRGCRVQADQITNVGAGEMPDEHVLGQLAGTRDGRAPGSPHLEREVSAPGIGAVD